MSLPDRRNEASLLDPRLMDPNEEVVRRAHLDSHQQAQVVEVLEAMNAWRDLEWKMSRAAGRYMDLGETDMRGLRYLIANQLQGGTVTPGAISAHLGISPAATTKLVDRLEKGGQVTRERDPRDRRRVTLTVTKESRASARRSVGSAHARRFNAIASLAPEDRRAVLRFFATLTEYAEHAGEEER